MDSIKIGELIRHLRKDKGITQIQLASIIGVSNKTVSKWECGSGCPDISLFSSLSSALGVNIENLLKGSLDVKNSIGGNMKNLKFYVCPICGNIITSFLGTSVSCCGKVLYPLEPEKAGPDGKLNVESIENDYFISSTHEMTKKHYISFVALVTGDTLFLKKLYPEWDMQTRIPLMRHGILFWYCTQHGLKYQLI
jgi:DNA-binding XRE family transcriptional regulator